jgi:hypothetical protein
MNFTIELGWWMLSPAALIVATFLAIEQDKQAAWPIVNGACGCLIFILLARFLP